MKHIAEDFKDILAGKPDKVMAANLLKTILQENGHHCKIIRRKTAAGRKIYFHINRTSSCSDEHIDRWWRTSENIIQIFFSEAHLISGNINGWIIAEY